MASQQVSLELLRSWAPGLPSGGGKEDRGRVLVIGGDAETVGAVLLAGEAALRVGAGKLQLACDPARSSALAVAVPEALVTDRAGAAELVGGADAVLIGPGLGDAEAAAELVGKLLPALEDVPLVLALAAADQVRDRRAPTLLTPNPKEAAHALDVSQDELGDCIDAALELAARTNAVVALGADRSVTATPTGDAWWDDAGDSALGVSGSGDVKAGAAVGLIARGVATERAGVLATWLHARAGARCGPIGYLARDIAAQLPAALSELSA